MPSSSTSSKSYWMNRPTSFAVNTDEPAMKVTPAVPATVAPVPGVSVAAIVL